MNSFSQFTSMNPIHQFTSNESIQSIPIKENRLSQFTSVLLIILFWSPLFQNYCFVDLTWVLLSLLFLLCEPWCLADSAVHQSIRGFHWRVALMIQYVKFMSDSSSHTNDRGSITNWSVASINTSEQIYFEIRSGKHANRTIVPQWILRLIVVNVKTVVNCPNNLCVATVKCREKSLLDFCVFFKVLS
jgi:hypothetical protein